MSDYYWQHATVTEIQKEYVTQVKYTINDVEGNADVVEIKQSNVHDKVSVPIHRVYLPQRYRTYLVGTFWRFYLLIELFNWFKTRRGKKFANFLPSLIKNMVHLDNVIEATICPFVDKDLKTVAEDDCPNYEEYLITEFLIGQHDPKTVAQFREQCPTNIERMDYKMFGELFCIIIITSKSMIGVPDWQKYAERLTPGLEGGKYSYTIDDVPDEDFVRLWKEVEMWYWQELDPEWSGCDTYTSAVWAYPPMIVSSWVAWSGEKKVTRDVDEQRMEQNEDEGHGQRRFANTNQAGHLHSHKIGYYN